MNTNNILVAENLSYVYEDNNLEAVKNVSLAVSRGSYVAILGLNGSGKSTLLKCCTDIVKPMKGAVYLNRKKLKSFKTEELGAQVGCSPQNPLL